MSFIEPHPRGCHVSLNRCRLSQDEAVRTRCFACGMPACKECTVIVQRWYWWRRKRVCQDCLAIHPKQGEQVEADNA